MEWALAKDRFTRELRTWVTRSSSRSRSKATRTSKKQNKIMITRRRRMT